INAAWSAFASFWGKRYPRYRWRPGYARQRLGDDAPASCQERLLCGRQLGTIVTARKQVAVSVQGYHNGCMPEPRLHDFRRQFQTAVLVRIDAPRGVKVPQCMQASVLGGEDWFAALIHDWRAILVRRRNCQPSLNHCDLQRARDGRKMLDLAAYAREDVVVGPVRLSHLIH